MAPSATAVSPSALAGAPASARRRARVAVAASAVATTLALWAIVEYGFDLDLRSPAFGDGDTADVGAAQIAVAAAIGSLLGWVSLALLERLTARAPKLWAIAAVAALLVSLGGPLGGSGVSGDLHAVLVSMHLLVAAVLLVGLYRTSPRRTAPS